MITFRRLLVAMAAAACAGGAAASTLLGTATPDARLLRGAFLVQGVGARAVGMGEAFTAVADDASCLYWNPGGLGQLGGVNAVATHDALDAGIGISYLGVAAPVGRATFGASIASLNFGSYDVRNEEGVKERVASLSDMAISGGVGFRNPSWLGGRGWTGISAVAVSESAAGMLLGLGIGGLVPIDGGLTGGWAIRNLGSAQGGFGLPAEARAGLAWTAPGRIRVAADGGYGFVDRIPWAAVGTEVWAAPFLVLRAGYKWRSNITGLTGLTGVTGGVGFRIARFGLDYAYQPFGTLMVSHRVSLVYGVGPEAPAVAAAPAAGAARPGSEDALFAEAEALAAAGDRKGALAKLRTLLKRAPGHWQGWQLAGNCLWADGNRAKAIESFRYSLKLHPENPELRTWLESVTAK